MSKALVKQEAEADVAFQLFTKLLDAKKEAGKQFLVLGETLTIINEKQWYKYFNVDSFEEFIAIPELGFARSTARLFMHVYDLYIRRLGLNRDAIAEIQISKLQKIASVVEQCPAEWLSMASTLSSSDLDAAVLESKGLPPRIRKKRDREEVSFREDYLDYVKNCACVACDAFPVDPHHFPRTKGAGGDDFKVIPLCRACHSEYHNDPHRFIIDNEERIFDYFYKTFYSAVRVLQGQGQKV